MRRTTTSDLSTFPNARRLAGGSRPLDRWLRFAPPIQARHDGEIARARVAEMQSAIVVGLLLYNLYNITSIVLLPDVMLLSVVLRVGVVTPTSLGLMWLIARLPPLWTERVVTAGILNAYSLPVFLFWWSDDAKSLHTFGELPLTIIFANLLLALRFPYACVFTASALALTLAAVATKTGLDLPLRLAFAAQFATACIFALYANYRQERRRCHDYLAALEATLEADSAKVDRQAFLDQSMTDALTQLPNRRCLTARLEQWVAEPQPVVLMMIDIDHFKLYNDTLGHPAGDDCLQRVAGALARCATEAGDAFCARFGGEEFAFAVRAANTLDAARVARTIVQAVAALDIRHPARSDGIGVVTVSIGVTPHRDGPSTSLADLVAAADRALYAAKRRGRNGFAMDPEHEAPLQAAG